MVITQTFAELTQQYYVINQSCSRFKTNSGESQIRTQHLVKACVADALKASYVPAHTIVGNVTQLSLQYDLTS